MRWLLLEEIIEIEKGKRVSARSSVPACEFSPEPLLIEMMAQTAGLLLGAETDYEKDIVFAKIESAEFLRPLKAGEVLWIEALGESLRAEGAWIDCSVRCQQETVSIAKVLLMQVDLLSNQSKQSITFHEAFMNHYKVRTKVR